MISAPASTNNEIQERPGLFRSAYSQTYLTVSLGLFAAGLHLRLGEGVFPAIAIGEVIVLAIIEFTTLAVSQF